MLPGSSVAWLYWLPMPAAVNTTTRMFDRKNDTECCTVMENLRRVLLYLLPLAAKQQLKIEWLLHTYSHKSSASPGGRRQPSSGTVYPPWNTTSLQPSRHLFRSRYSSSRR